MSFLIDDPAGAAAGGSTLLLVAGALLWRLGGEFERGWRRAEAAAPQPWEQELFERMYRENRSSRERPEHSVATARDAQVRAPALA